MKSINRYLEQLSFGQIEIKGSAANIAILLARIYAGYTIMISGLDKIPMTDWMFEQVSSMGFPFPGTFAWLAAFSEFAFGCLLVLGILTRFSSLILSVSMGVAAFAFQQVLPLGEMHISQHYFWIFVLFLSIGGGKYSFDYYINRSKLNFKQKLLFTALPALIVVLFMGILRQISN